MTTPETIPEDRASAHTAAPAGAAGATGIVDDPNEVEALRQRVAHLEAEHAAMRQIVLRVAEARTCRDATTMIESCPHCSLQRGGAYGYSGHHNERCIVAAARRLGF